MELQVLDGRFTMSQEGDPNINYSKIINYDICPSPDENNTYQNGMNNRTGDLPDRANYFLRKRRGCVSSEFRTLPLSFEQEGFDVTDHKFVDGTNFLMAVNKSKTELVIFKQLGVPDTILCENRNEIPFDVGYFENITFNYYETPILDSNLGGAAVAVRYLPTLPCLSHKFTVSIGPKKLVKKNKALTTISYSPSHGLSSILTGRIVNQLVGTEILTYFVDQDGLVGNLGDFVLLYDGDFSTQHLGISALQNGVRDNSPGFLMEGPFAGYADVGSPTQANLGPGADIVSGDATISSPHGYLVFEERGDVLYFVTSDGIMGLHDHGQDSDDSLFVYEGNTYKQTYNNLVKPRFEISSMVDYGETVVFIDRKRGQLYHGLYGYQNIYFDPRNTLTIGDRYEELAKMSGYVGLLGSEEISLVNPQNVGPGQITFGGFVSVSESVGLRNYGSWRTDGGLLYWFGSDKQLRTTTVETYSATVIVPKTEIVNLFYQSDFARIGRYIDFVYLSSDGRRQFVSILPKDNNGSIVYVRDLFWHKWIYESLQARSFSRSGIIGGGAFGYSYAGRDDGNEIKTLIQMNFGEYTQSVVKSIVSLKYPIGYNSNITFGNTVLRVRSLLGGYVYSANYGELFKREYIEVLMNSKKASVGGTDVKDDGMNNKYLYSPDFPATIKTSTKEIDSFSSMNFSFPYDTLDYEISYEVGKYSVIEEQMGGSIEGNSIIFEFITKGDDEIEFGGFMVVYSNKDINETRIDDTGIVGKIDLTN